MPAFTCESDALGVVLRGSFNPVLPQPAWMAKHELVSPEQEAAAKIGLISPQLTEFEIADYKIFIDNTRFQAITESAEAARPLRDLVAGVFSILEHTPINACGINRSLHFRMPDDASWHRVGNALAPKELWEQFFT